MGGRRWLVGVFFDAVAVILTGVTYYLLEKGALKTAKTGFHLDDKTIDAPYTPFEEDTVPAELVTIVAVTLGLLLPAVEFVVAGCKRKWKARQLCTRSQWASALRILLAYVYGLLLTCVVTSVLKILVGRLRPHFMDLCRPNYTLPAVGSSRYISEYTCTNPRQVPEKWVQNVYWSFPSGHSSVSAYCCFFFIVYLQLRWRHNSICSTLYKTVPQGILLAFALIGAYSRVRDHKHHWSDVSGGLTLGTAIAVWMVLFVIRPIMNESSKHGRDTLLPQSSMEASVIRESSQSDGLM